MQLAALIALSISVKLLPLLLLPLFLKNLGWKGYFFYIIVGVCIALPPFLSKELIQNYSETIGLWFTNFEFNASIYIIRQIGFWITGYNIIHITGKSFPVILLFVLYQSFNTKNKTTIDLLNHILLYVLINLILIEYSQIQIPLVSEFNSDFEVYINPEFKDFWLIGLEYFIVFAFIICEKELSFLRKQYTKTIEDQSTLVV
jgi:hypothetical protein